MGLSGWYLESDRLDGPGMRSGALRAFDPGIRAVQTYWKPFVAIQVATAFFVVAYYAFPGLQVWCEGIEAAKARGGFAFSFVTGAIAGGAMPEIAKALTGARQRAAEMLGDACYNGLVFGIVGMAVDALYRIQALVFGTGHSLGVVVCKVAVDQSAFTPLVSVPVTIALVRWRMDRRETRRLWENWTLSGYRAQVAPKMPTAWAFWIPVVTCVYFMPLLMQFPLSILANAAWSLLFVFAARLGPEAAEA